MHLLRVVLGALLLGSGGVGIWFAISPSNASSVEPRPTAVEIVVQEYERLLEPYQDWTFEQLEQHLGLEVNRAKGLSFDPETAARYSEIKRSLKLTEEESRKFKANGLVVVDPNLRHSFGSVYYQVYASHLPVLVTTDSVLHAWHRSYDNLLRELEGQILMPALADLLQDCHELLAKQANASGADSMMETYRDVDLYLTVARNLLAGEGGQRWKGNLSVPAVFRMDDEAVERLADIKSLKLQVQYPRTESTIIYGGERFVDYSQFRPRGHYTKSTHLKSYFRCMMWLGRADCGFSVLPVDPVAQVNVDWRRELRDAALVSQLVRDSGSYECLRSIASVVQLLVGEGDNLTVSGMLSLFESERIQTAGQLTDTSDPTVERLADAIYESGLARQRIRSQAIVSNPLDTHKVPPPAIFQLFGQAFAIDSFLLSHSVFDSIIFDDYKQRRMMPTSLDVAAMLGNNHATRLLEPELRNWNYSANLLAGRDFVEQLQPRFWNGNVYHRWLDALRTLHNRPESADFPEVMQGPVWRAKQLQTQLASWSELRHDNVLYSKQSYTGVPSCEYPDGYVEPYPELYRKLGEMATATAVKLGGLNVRWDQPNMMERTRERQVTFLHRFAEIMDELEVIAQQELNARPMTDKQRRFIEATIDRRGSLPIGSGRRPRYDGWYCELLYNEINPSGWDPTIVDVHTHPSAHDVLHVGVGDVNFVVVAVDNQDDVAAYVGPVYSYYEFTEAAEKRLDDRKWQRMIAEDSLPPRPDWTSSFAASPVKRTYNGLSVQGEQGEWLVMESVNGQLKESFRANQNDEGLESLLDRFQKHGFPGHFGIALGEVSAEGLKSLLEVTQLTWVDIAGSKLPDEAIEDLRRRRPDIEVLPRAFGVESVVICKRIDGLRRFQADVSGKLIPGQPLLLYVEPQNVTWTHKNFRTSAKLAIKTTLIDPSGDAFASQVFDLPAVRDGQPGEPMYSEVKVAVPPLLKRGAYKLRVDLEDALADRERTATAEFPLKY